MDDNSIENLTIQEQLSIKQQKLEIEKVQIELKTLNRPWFKNHTYLTILLPSILALLSLMYAISTGFFDRKYELYKLEKASLELDIRKFETEKSNLITEKDSAIADKQKLKTQIENLKIQVVTLNQKANSNANNIKLKYDHRGNIVEANQNNNKVQYNYDSLNRLTNIVDSIKKGTTFSYDNMNRIVKVTYPTGQTVTYTYNGYSDVTSKRINTDIALPSVNNVAAFNITSTSATINGFYNGHGLSTVTYFQWGKGASIGQTTPAITQSRTTGVMTENLTNLTPNTKYSFRAVATNYKGTTYAINTFNFTTLRE